MTQTLLTRRDEGAVATLTMTAPATLNALSVPMLAALAEAFARLEGDTAIRAVVLRGEGKAFCAGHDLREMQAARRSADGGRAWFSELFARAAAVMQAIPRLPQPVIAEVHGIATAAGCQLVASCDMAVAAEGTRFGVNGVNIGLFCSTPMVALTRNIPRKSAFEMLTTGAFIDADRALALGLVNRVVPAKGLSEETAGLARSVAGKLGAAVRIGKQAFYEQAAMDTAGAYAYAGRVMAENMMLRDTDEGICAFLDKRKPDWPV
ncbi:enoyl-CoA hydratase [Ruixingdingia sedimenti]|uniref:Enoyl-CoA hydratase domain-containing protein 3, mitochondrial n=1 Tax=Ruixingdingia sedimenti TaxID=3073604 RepID=A0ABU1FDR8_9RHOB|nr:enoyl-CoA hydratase [Xinfangfangia sp. LG-4]MDR5655016.1 enoyl-CoA hydratase [Xinfangfangia sp. LG-4]